MKAEAKKVSNKSKILAYIWQRGESSKQELAKGLSLSMPTVLQCTNELLEQGVLLEQGEYESTGGRKAKVITLNAGLYYAVGIDVTRNHISYVLIDMKCSMLRHERIRRRYENTREYYGDLKEMLEAFLDFAGTDRAKILGAGISLPGILDSGRQILVHSHALQVNHLRLENIGRYIGYPVRYENDANSAMLAEMAREPQDAVFLSLSNTVGGAVYLEGRLYAGQNSRSGEYGHMIVEKGGKSCYCGKKGCLDAYCAAHVLSSATNDNLEEFFRRLEEGEEALFAVWEEYLEYLAIGVTNLRMCYDCDVILGGYVGAYMGKYLLDLSEKMKAHDLFDAGSPYVKACRCKTEAAGVGAASEFIREYLRRQ